MNKLVKTTKAYSKGEIRGKIPKNILGNFREISGKFPGFFLEISGKFPGKFTMVSLGETSDPVGPVAIQWPVKAIQHAEEWRSVHRCAASLRLTRHATQAAHAARYQSCRRRARPASGLGPARVGVSIKKAAGD